MKLKKLIILTLIVFIASSKNSKCLAKYVFEDIIKAAEITIINN